MSSSPKDVIKYIPDIIKSWYEVTGLLTTCLVLIVVEITIFIATKPSFIMALITVIISCFIVTIVWVFSRKIPVTPKNKIGFLVSIYCSDDENEKQIREDFIVPLRKLIKTGKSGKIIHFIEIKNFLAKDIQDIDQAQLVRAKSKAHFMLFGRVRERIINKENKCLIELDGIVAHKPITQQASQSLSNEFFELLPRRVTLDHDNPFLFEFTSEWAEIVARYIIGIAAAYSGDLNNAESLYIDCLNKLKQKNDDFPIYFELKKRLPIRISEIYEVRAFIDHRNWIKNQNPQHIENLGNHLSKIKKTRFNNSLVFNLSAIYQFIKFRNTKKSRQLLERSKNKDGTWHFNMAFLYGYDKNLKKAIRHYRNAIKIGFKPDAMSQVEDFIIWVIESEPEQYQLNYCLGFFNWKVKEDNIRAEKFFNDFLQNGKEFEFEKERELTKSWLNKIDGLVKSHFR